MKTNGNKVKLFAGRASSVLANSIAEAYGQELGSATVQEFKDGEFSPLFDESVRGCDVFIIQSTHTPCDNLMELLLMIDAAKRASAHYITAVIPYFGFARQDRKDKPRVGIGAKLVANLLTVAGATRIITMDLHAPQIQGFFDIPVDHLEATPVFVSYIKELGLENLTFAAPDMGATPRARKYAKYFNADIVICDKQRKRANEIDEMTVIGDVRGRNVIIPDDLVDTAKTLCTAAEKIMENGALSVRAMCTHPVMSDEAFKRVMDSALTELIITDTIPRTGLSSSSKIRILSVAELFGKSIRKIYNYESINDLFL